MIDGVDFLVKPVIVMDNCFFAVIWHKVTGNAAKVFIHMYMGINQGAFLLFDESFNMRMLVVCQHCYE